LQSLAPAGSQLLDVSNTFVVHKNHNNRHASVYAKSGQKLRCREKKCINKDRPLKQDQGYKSL